ncbi:MAG TPA: hypothetical protein PLJ12_14225, partial [Planctomycetota bacterium]|nr:hypothetical protein [Planctomycetota bacterium]
LSLALWDWGTASSKLPDHALGLPAQGVQRVRIPLPTRWQSKLGPLGMHPGRLMRPLDGFHRIQPDRPWLGQLPFTSAVVELPTPGSPAQARLRRDLESAQAVLVFSRAVAARVPGELGVEPQKVVQVPVGADHWWRDLGERQPAPKPQVVVLGALRKARRIETLLAGMQAYWSQGGVLDLCLLGTLTGDVPGIERAWQTGPNASKIRHALPPEAELPSWVAASHGLLHLAVDEGSPVTPLEAVRLGVHPVLESLPAFREAFAQLPGAAPIWLERDPQPEAIAAALFALEARPRAEPLACPEFTWEASARAHAAAWKRCFA